MNPRRQLSDEDQARVDDYLQSGYNRSERKPFRPLLLLFVLWIVVMLLGLVAFALSRYFGVL
jgi:hypothetical protein